MKKIWENKNVLGNVPSEPDHEGPSVIEFCYKVILFRY